MTLELADLLATFESHVGAHGFFKRMSPDTCRGHGNTQTVFGFLFLFFMEVKTWGQMVIQKSHHLLLRNKVKRGA